MFSHLCRSRHSRSPAELSPAVAIANPDRRRCRGADRWLLFLSLRGVTAVEILHLVSKYPRRFLPVRGFSPLDLPGNPSPSNHRHQTRSSSLWRPCIHVLVCIQTPHCSAGDSLTSGTGRCLVVQANSTHSAVGVIPVSRNDERRACRMGPLPVHGCSM